MTTVEERNLAIIETVMLELGVDDIEELPAKIDELKATISKMDELKAVMREAATWLNEFVRQLH